MIKRFLTMLIAFTFVFICACGPTPSPLPAPTPAEDGETVWFTDSAGRGVLVPKTINRIIPSGISAQIVLYSLAPDLLAGLAEQWPPEAEPFIETAYTGMPVVVIDENTTHENILAANAQIIIDIGFTQPSTAASMDAAAAKTGLPAVHISSSIEQMPEMYRTLGALLNREDRAEELARFCERTLDAALKSAASAGENGRLSALYCLEEGGLSVMPRGSQESAVIDMLADNLATGETPPSGMGVPVSMEQMRDYDPDVIFFAPEHTYESVASDPVWHELKAVQSGRYYEIPLGPFNWMGFPPSINQYLSMLWTAKLLYPQHATYDLYSEVSDFFKLFYRHELTKEQYDLLTANSPSPNK